MTMWNFAPHNYDSWIKIKAKKYVNCTNGNFGYDYLVGNNFVFLVDDWVVLY